MTPEVADRLRALNRQFYELQADSFAESRVAPQPGFTRLLDWLPPKPVSLLDVGCGNGRFGQFLAAHHRLARYVGVDFSTNLLQKAQALLPTATFYERDMTQPDFLADLEQFDLVACLAAMQHVPGHVNRALLLQEMAAQLLPDGRIFLANWQFMNSPRQRRKLRDWAEVGLSSDQVEANDYLLTWQRQGFGLRYVCQVDEAETAELAQNASLSILHQFYSDGREGQLTLYSILTHKHSLQR